MMKMTLGMSCDSFITVHLSSHLLHLWIAAPLCVTNEFVNLSASDFKRKSGKGEKNKNKQVAGN